ncbi:MAG: class I SAM-dependent methyltransferase [Alphaproteobacteria bacterium]
MTALERSAAAEAPLFVHRNEIGRSYRGLPVLAAPGVHEFIAGWLHANRPHDAPVLEVGAGTGALTARLMDRGFEVVPVDSQPAPFTRCCPAFVQVDFNDPHWTRSLPEPAFETVVAAEIIAHLENPRKLIRDLFTACAPGGEAVVTTPNVLCASSLAGFLRRGRFYGFDPQAREAAGQISILPWWLIDDFAREAGFAETEILFIGDLERPWWKKPLLRLADSTLRRLRHEPDPVSGCGNVVMVRMRKGMG